VVTYTIDVNQRLIRTICSGFVTLDEVTAHFRELAGDPACPNHLDVLLDLSAVDSLPQKSQLQAVTVELARLSAKVRFGHCAIVVQRTVLFGMFRMFEVMAQDYFTAIRVFRVAAEAEVWLASQRLPAR
jgi:hypothetical protein